MEQNKISLVPAIAVVVVPALERTSTAAFAAAITRVCSGLGYGYTDGPAVNGSTIQFCDCLLGSFIVRHFNECKPAGFAGEFVHNYFGRSYFAVFCEIVL